MKIDENTKVILRLHTTVNNRGLNIYNPYFVEADVNAVYILTYNQNPEPLVQGIRNLNFSGAISAGFETDQYFANLLDELTEVASEVGHVGMVSNINGHLVGHYQGGQGLYSSTTAKYGRLSGKKVVVLGAGTVTKALLYEMNKQNDVPDITLVNRTVINAEVLAERYGFVATVKPFSEIESVSGEILINTTKIGAPWNSGDDYIFKPELLKRFGFISDVAFVPIAPQLITLANELGIPNSPGYEMFAYQAGVCMEKIIGHTLNRELFIRYMLDDFKHNWS